MEMSPFLFGLYKLVKYGIYPLTWVFVLLGLLAILATLPATPQRHRWMRCLAVLSLLLLFVFGNRFTSQILAGLVEERSPRFDQSTMKRYDTIVVLGSGAASRGTLRPSDELSSVSIERTLCGIELFRNGFAPRLLFAGGDASIFGYGPKESLEMKRLALQLGVPEEAILIEDRSRTTYENAVETKRILGNGSIIMVTSAIHVPRAWALFRKQGLDTTPYACGYMAQDIPSLGWDGDPFDFIPDAKALHRNTDAISEVVGILFYRASGKL